MKNCRALCALVLAMMLAGVSVGQAEVIDRIMVTVSGEAITLSRVRFMHAYLKVTGGEGMGRPLPDPAALSQGDVLEILEDDAIIFGLAARLPMVGANSESVHGRRQWFREQFGDAQSLDTFVDTWGFDADEQWRFFQRREVIEGFIKLKIGAYSRIPPKDLKAFFEENQAHYAGSLESMRSDVENDYRIAHQSETFDHWIENYKRNHRDIVRYTDAGPDGGN